MSDKMTPATDLEALVRKLIPAAVIFADSEEHVADLRRRAMDLLTQGADSYADVDDPERCAFDPHDFAAEGSIERGEVFRAYPWKALPSVWIACGFSDDGTEESRAFSTEAEARAWAERPDPSGGEA